VVRGGVEPPTFRFSGLRTTVQDRPCRSFYLFCDRQVPYDRLACTGADETKTETSRAAMRGDRRACQYWELARSRSRWLVQGECRSGLAGAPAGPSRCRQRRPLVQVHATDAAEPATRLPPRTTQASALNQAGTLITSTGSRLQGAPSGYPGKHLCPRDPGLAVSAGGVLTGVAGRGAAGAGRRGWLRWPGVPARLGGPARGTSRR